MLDLFIIGAILMTLYKVFRPSEIREFIEHHAYHHKKLQKSLIFKLLDDKGGVHMKKLVCDKCKGKGCQKCAGIGHYHVSGVCTDQCPHYCLKIVAHDGEAYCLGGACTPNIDLYDRLKSWIGVLRT